MQGEKMRKELTFMEAVTNYRVSAFRLDRFGTKHTLGAVYSDEDIFGKYYIDEPEKTLSDKIITSNTEDYKLTVTDVKEALKKFIGWCDMTLIRINNSNNLMHDKAKEIFGEELVK
jgi:hypothetical protein